MEDSSDARVQIKYSSSGGQLKNSLKYCMKKKKVCLHIFFQTWLLCFGTKILQLVILLSTFYQADIQRVANDFGSKYIGPGLVFQKTNDSDTFTADGSMATTGARYAEKKTNH